MSKLPSSGINNEINSSTMNNDYKYEDVDYGFTAVDEEELNELRSGPQEVSVKIDGVDSEIQNLAAKIQELVELQTDIMSELVDKKQMYEEKLSGLDITSEVTEDKLMKVEKLIMPLLYNLLKNKEKDYIYWPNREPIIKSQIEKISEITRGFYEG